MAQNTDLGNLIMLLNPYTKAGVAQSQMDIYTTNPTPKAGGAQGGAIAQVQMQVDDYSGEWTFGGQPQHVKRSVRILYRYPVLDSSNNVLYWLEDYLLIGYQGAGGN